MYGSRVKETSFHQSHVIYSGSAAGTNASYSKENSSSMFNHSYNNTLSYKPPEMNRSFISTSLVTDSMAYGDDLRKSRIQNLPNYKKTNLSDNLQFIVVFQTIQIERLSNQVEVLRVRLKQNQRQLFNAQNYQVQIRELTQKCFQLESERQSYYEQTTKLGKICEQLYHQNEMYKKKLQDHDFSLKQKYESQKIKNEELSHEIQKWKTRYHATERSKTKQLQDLRNLMQSQRKSMIDRQIREITIKFQNQRSMLENQIRKGRELLENRNREIEDYRQKVQKYEISISELRQFQNIITDNENKIVLLNQQLLRINQVLKRKQEEIHEFRQRQYKYSQQLKEQQQWEYQNKQLKQVLQNRVKQIEDWKIRNSRNEAQVIKCRQLEHYNNQLADKLQVTGRQIERLNSVLRNKLDQIEQWKKRLSDKDMQLNQLKNVQDQLANYQSKFGMMSAENNRIESLLKSAKVQIEDWKSKNNGLQQTINDFSSVRSQKTNLQNNYNKSIKHNEELQFIIKQLESDKSHLKDYQNRYQDLQRNNGSLTKQIERLNNIIRSNTNQLNQYQVRYNNLQTKITQYKNYDSQIRDLQNKIAMMVTQNERLNGLIKTRNDEIEALEKDKIQMHSKITHYKNYQIKISQNDQLVKRLNDQIANMKRDGNEWQNKYKAFESKYHNLENQVFGERQERQKLNNVLKQRTNDYETLRMKVGGMEEDCRKLNHLEQVASQQHSQIMNYVTDLQRADSRMQQLQQTIQRQRSLGNQLAFRVVVLSCEVERLLSGNSKSAGIKSRQFQELKEHYSRLQSKMTSKNNEIDILMTRVQSLQSQIGRLTEQFKNLLIQVEQSEKQSQNMIHKIEQYQDYAKRIHILGAEIDRLNSQNKAFEEDAKKIRLKFADGFAVEKRHQDFNLMTVLMALQIQNLRSRLDQREINIDEMRKSILEPVRKV